MSRLLSVAPGWTGVLGPFTLLVDGVALNLAGLTVTVEAHDTMGTVIALGGTVTILNQVTYPGKVTYAPAAADFEYLPLSGPGNYKPYRIRWKVVDGVGAVVFFPNGDADEIHVYKA